MEHLPAFKAADYNTRSGKIFDAVARGDVRAMLNDEIVPKAHIRTYLELYTRANPEQVSGTLPPDLAINLDDFTATFDRPNADSRKRGRPRKEEKGWSEDRRWAQRMHRMLADPYPLVSSAAEAARAIVKYENVSGAGTPESKAKRLERVFRIHYSSP